MKAALQFETLEVKCFILLLVVQECIEAAKAWAQWECRISRMVADLDRIKTRLQNESWVLSFARIEW